MNDMEVETLERSLKMLTVKGTLIYSTFIGTKRKECLPVLWKWIIKYCAWKHEKQYTAQTNNST